MKDKPLQLLIHGGLNKAGSSYLQGVFHANADVLRRAGISYRGGGPSAGNAKGLSMAIRAADHATAGRFLADHAAEARAARCDRVLVSAEYLYHDMVVADRLATLRDLAGKAGLDRLSVLLFFRDPVSHAISAYCHRSGHQDLGPFEAWVRNTYEVPRELPRFLATLDEAPDIDWRPRAYSKGGLVDEACTWLGVEALPEAVPVEVNVSVSVDEAEILNRLRMRDPRAARSLRQALKAVPRDGKTDDSALRSRYRVIAARALKPLNPELDRLGALVGAEMSVPEPGADAAQPAADEAVTLSAAQVDAILGLCKAPPRRRGPRDLAKAALRRIGKRLRPEGMAR